MDVVRELQAGYACGVMVLTGRGYLSDRVMGLELGADDYVVKPFEPRELVARVRSILRRKDTAHSSAAQSEMRSRQAEFGGWRFLADSNRLSSPSGQEWTLSAGESAMLLHFLQRPNRILDHEQLCGDRDLSALDRGVDVRVSRLRRKLESDPSTPPPSARSMAPDTCLQPRSDGCRRWAPCAGNRSGRQRGRSYQVMKAARRRLSAGARRGQHARCVNTPAVPA